MGNVINMTGGGGGSGIKLVSIAITTQPTKRTYNALETFSTAGMVVTATYTNGAIAIATGYTYDTSPLQYGTSSVTISYTEGGITKTASVSITVVKNTLAVPSQSVSLTYNGNAQTVSWSNYNSSYMTKSGTETATNAGSNTVTFSLRDTTNYQWSGGTTSSKSVTWTIAKANLSTPYISGSLTYNGSSQSPTIVGYDSSKESKSGTQSATNAGSYTVTVSITDSNYKFSDGTTSKSLSWSIGKATPSFSLSTNSVTLNDSYNSRTVTITTNGDGSISQSSSNTSIATVSRSGYTVTITGTGTSGSATVTVTLSAGTNYNGASGSVAVTASYTGRLYLYNEGDECTSVTGGWSSGYKWFNDSYYSNMGTITKNSNNMELSCTPRSSLLATSTVNTVNVSSFSSLKFEISQYESSADGIKVFADTKTYLSTFSSGNELQISGTGIFTIDISGITGNRYIGFRLWNGYNYVHTNTCKCTKVWLE